MTEKNNILENISFAIDCGLALGFLIMLIYNLAKGCSEHDTYYLVMTIIDYGFMRLSVKNIYRYLDIKD